MLCYEVKFRFAPGSILFNEVVINCAKQPSVLIQNLRTQQFNCARIRGAVTKKIGKSWDFVPTRGAGV